MKYIGIRGHRGAGKNTISYLLGSAIEYYENHKGFDDFKEVYDERVKECIENENFINDADLEYVYFESFADTLKMLVNLLTSIPLNYMYDDWKKDSVFFNLIDFSYVECLSDKEIYKMNKNAFTVDDMNYYNWDMENDKLYMSLRTLILYVGKMYTKSFGKDVWVKSLKANKAKVETFFNNKYKIFTDVKFPTEVTYVKDNIGTVICVERPGNKKEDTIISDALSRDTRIDYVVEIGDTLDSCYDMIIKIAREICER